MVAPADVERARLCFAQAQRGERRKEIGDGLSPFTSHLSRFAVVAGGEERQASVRAGLAEISPDCDWVLVHDAARPFLRSELIRRCLEAVGRHEAVVAALPATDTVKEVGEEGAVAATLDRSRLWLVQTPQVFRYSLLAEAHAAAAGDGFVGTDDASLVERLGHRVHVVSGDPENIKITYEEDLRRAEQHLQFFRGSQGQALYQGEHTMGRERPLRAGIGYDAHPFMEGRALVLAGVRFPGERGLAGHSDADVVCHAICDALLGAMGAGDIGQHFPDTDPQYAGISSLALLARVGALMRQAGWELENVDAVMIAEAPRIAARLPEMRAALAGALGTELERVSVKGKTTEGLGFTGRGEGIASQAMVLLRKESGAEGEEGRC